VTYRTPAALKGLDRVGAGSKLMPIFKPTMQTIDSFLIRIEASVQGFKASYVFTWEDLSSVIVKDKLAALISYHHIIHLKFWLSE